MSRYIYQQNTLANTHDVKVKLPNSNTENIPLSKEEWAEKFNKRAPAHIQYYVDKQTTL